MAPAGRRKASRPGQSPIRGQYIEALKAADQCDISRLVELHDRYAMRE